MKSKSEAVQQLYKVLPYAKDMKELDINSEPDAISFKWRTQRFRISITYEYRVEELQNGLLISNNITVLLQALLNEKNDH